MSKAEVVNVQTLYTELKKHIRISEWKQVLKTCNKIIHTKDGRQETLAMISKIVCFINMSQFAEALKFIAATPEVQEEATFEKAYCQYRLLKLDEALETINDVAEPDLRTLDLKAQIFYKLGRYSDCLPIYKKLMKECSDDMEEERMTNYIAVNAALSMFENTKTKLKLNPTSHEQYFNAGCMKIGEEEYEEAYKLFQQAETACRQMLAEEPDVTEEEVEADVAPIKVQMAYTLQSMGKEDEALAIYHQIVRARPSDVALLAVASNNIITINRDQNVFDSRKRMKATVANGVDSKLVLQQKKKIDFNRALLFMYSNQWDSCKQLLKTMKSKFQGEEMPYLIQATMLCREKNLSEAITYLLSYIETHSDPEFYGHLDMTNVKLALIQMMLQNEQIQEACQLLESMEDICYKPAIISLLVALYKQNGDNVEAITQLFDRAIKWNMLNKDNKAELMVIMWKCALFHVQHQNNQQAAQVLETMLSMDPNNVKVMAQLIFAYSKLNREKAHQISERLPSLSELSIEVNVDELEAAASAPRYIKRQKEKKIETSVGGGDQVVKKLDVVSERSQQMIKTKKKKKKKNPAPRHFRADFVPDPERWVPLRERSTYKGRRKDKRKGAVMKGSQGTFSSAADQYDMSLKPSTSGTSQAASSSSNTNVGASSSGQQAVAGTSQQQTSSPKPTTSRSNQPNKNKKKKKRGKGGW